MTGNSLRHEELTLHMRGAAMVEVIDTNDEGDAKLRHEQVRLDQRFLVEGKTLTTDQLLAAGEFSTYPIELRRYGERRVGQAIGTSVVVLATTTFGLGILCAIECRQGSSARTASEIGVISLGGLAVIGLAAIIVHCVRSGSCPD